MNSTLSPSVGYPIYTFVHINNRICKWTGYRHPNNICTNYVNKDEIIENLSSIFPSYKIRWTRSYVPLCDVHINILYCWIIHYTSAPLNHREPNNQYDFNFAFSYVVTPQYLYHMLYIGLINHSWYTIIDVWFSHRVFLDGLLLLINKLFKQGCLVCANCTVAIRNLFLSLLSIYLTDSQRRVLLVIASSQPSYSIATIFPFF